jgi:predicted glycosyltransferase
LRDVLDEPKALAAEWERKRASNAVEQLYDAVMIYGLKSIYAPLQGLGLSAEVDAKTTYTGYLKRSRPATRPTHEVSDLQNRVLITAGGGGDGETLINWILSTYEAHGPNLPPALVVPGPFMAAEARHQFEQRIARQPQLRTFTFEPRMEHLMAGCKAVVAMGGYNTFCEILSFDKRAILVPRSVPRCEQTIRAQAAHRLKLARWVPEPNEGEAPNVDLMADALRHIHQQPKPSEHAQPGLLDGLNALIDLSRGWLARPRAHS